MARKKSKFNLMYLERTPGQWSFGYVIEDAYDDSYGAPATVHNAERFRDAYYTPITENNYNYVTHQNQVVTVPIYPAQLVPPTFKGTISLKSDYGGPIIASQYPAQIGHEVWVENDTLFKAVQAGQAQIVGDRIEITGNFKWLFNGRGPRVRWDGA